MTRPAEIVVATQGPVSIWVGPEKDEDYIVGVDSAEGVRGGAYSAAVCLRARDCAVVAIAHGHIPPTPWGRMCALLGWYYLEAILAFETYPTAHGLVAARAAIDWGYGRFYTRIVTETTSKTPTDKIGWHSDKKSMSGMMDRVRTAVMEGASIPSRDLIRELLGVKYDAAGFPFTDTTMDLVDAYGIALCVRDQCYARSEIRAPKKRALTESEEAWAELEKEQEVGKVGQEALCDGSW